MTIYDETFTKFLCFMVIILFALCVTMTVIYIRHPKVITLSAECPDVICEPCRCPIVESGTPMNKELIDKVANIGEVHSR